MNLSLLTDGFGSDSEYVFGLANKHRYTAVEIATCNWCGDPPIDMDELISSAVAREHLKESLKRHNLTICALNCSGNQLAPGERGRSHAENVLKTFRCAEKLGIQKIVMMSGLPGGGPKDEYSNWVVASWPEETQEILNYQWEVTLAYWEKTVRQAKECGIQKIALENHPYQMVYNVETLLKLRNAVDPLIGMNVDPSHCFWMGGDPIMMLRALGPAIHHIHAKDARIEPYVAGINGLLESKPIDYCATRAWNYATVGYGHGLGWWKRFFAEAQIMGYDGAVSVEIEDKTMSSEIALKKATEILRQAVI